VEKVKIFLPTPSSRIGGAEIELHAFLTLALVGVEWPTSRPSRITVGKQLVPIE